jgi:predicted nucleic acid-binding protein
MTKLIVDESVAARWFVPVLAWPAATALLNMGQPLAAPELILAEAANAFWKAVRAGYMTASEMRASVAQLPNLFDELASLQDLATEAAAISIEINHPVYDCFYLALAKCEAAPLVTADKRLAVAAQALSDVEVRLLGN